MSHDTVYSGRFFFRGEVQDLDVGVTEGRITGISRNIDSTSGRRKLPGVVLPSGTDVHVHSRVPGGPHKEDIPSITGAAARGGVTAILDMPNTSPPILTHEALIEKRETITGRNSIDMGMFLGLSDAVDPVNEVRKAVRDGHSFFKAYLGASTGNLKLSDLGTLVSVQDTIEEERGGVASDDADVDDGLRVKIAPLMSLHCEDEAFFGPPGKDLAGHYAARPLASEKEMVSRVLDLQPRERFANSGVNWNVCHISSKDTLRTLWTGPVLKEVAPHHLLLDVSMRKGPLGKVNPPLRGPEEREALLTEFVSGHADILGSDHAPHTLQEKEDVPFMDAPSGVPGVETTYPLMMALVKQDVLPLEVLVRTFAENPGRLLRGSGVRTGFIEEGFDFSVACFDSRKVTRIGEDDTHYRCGWTPYEGHQAIFPVATYLRGHDVFDGETVDGTGRVLP